MQDAFLFSRTSVISYHFSTFDLSAVYSVGCLNRSF